MYTPVWITFPAGRFTMGSDPRHAAPPFPNEVPRQRLILEDFRISRVPITNAQYYRFVVATGYAPPGHWPDGAPPTHSASLPVTYVTWHDAWAFCKWAGIRLPNEAEWEKAARGPASADAPVPEETRWWPWGNDLPDATRAHFNGQAQGVPPAAQGVMPVGQFPRGASPYGVLDMAGNVWEWRQSLYGPYPYAADGREAPDSELPRVLRGGSFLSPSAAFVRCAMRSLSYPTRRREHIGFRVAQPLPP